MGSTVGLRAPFKKGESGNPGGRPAVSRDFRERCRDFMDKEGWQRLATMARGKTRHAYPALELIAAYAYGKPSQPITGEDGGPVQFAIQALVADIRGVAERLNAGELDGRTGLPALDGPDGDTAESADATG